MSFGSILSKKWLLQILNSLGVPTFDDGTGKQVAYKEATIDLAGSGDYSGGEIKVVREGNQVTIDVATSISHTILANPQSASGLLPTWARPPSRRDNTYSVNNSNARKVQIKSDGTFSNLYVDWTGTNTALSAPGDFLTISYNI